MNATEDADLVIGAGTHLDTHYRGDLRCRGRAVSQLQVAATTAGYKPLLAWSGRRPGAARSSGRWKVPGITAWAWPGT